MGNLSLAAGEVRAVSNPIRHVLFLDKTALGPGVALPGYVRMRKDDTAGGSGGDRRMLLGVTKVVFLVVGPPK